MKQGIGVKSEQSWYYGAGCLFSLEVFVSAFMHNSSIRPYVGDLLAVVFLYCLARSVVALPAKPTILGVLLSAYAIEISQYFHLAAHLGVQYSRLALVVLGSHFAWVDMLAYTLGALLLAATEWGLAARRRA